MNHSSRKHNWLLTVSTALVVPFTAMNAYAHAETGVAGGLSSGLMHPVTGVDHMIAMVAVGIWGAQLGRPAIWILPIAFPVVMAFGGLLGLSGLPIPATLIELGIALSAVVLGLLVAFRLQVPLWSAAAIVSFFALCHGHAHGTELPSAANALAYGVGFVIATGLLHLCGILLGELTRFSKGETIIRLIGALIAVLGLVFLSAIILELL